MPYEFNGKKYEKASSHQKEWGSKLIVELNLKGSERVLDLGCGEGWLTSQIAELVPTGRVLGIDASLGMIDAALPKQRSNIRFQMMDINKLDFENEFDVVFANASLHWVLDHEYLLKNVYRALRVGGCIRFQFAGNGNCMNFFTVVREAMEVDEFRSHFIGFEWPWFMPSVDEYSRMVESSGLRDVRVWGENADRYLQDEEEMIRWIDQPSLVPFLALVSEADKTSFRDFVLGRIG